MNEQLITVEAEPFAEQTIDVEQEGIEQEIELEREYVYLSDVPSYTGAYEFTPSENTQTINIANHKAVADITINPIPSNYGRIEWNGTTLMVY